jgi:hypothetical protein
LRGRRVDEVVPSFCLVPLASSTAAGAMLIVVDIESLAISRRMVYVRMQPVPP